MPDVIAYLDESGNTDLETTKDGASDYFIICAIVVEESERDALELAAEAIRAKYFQTGEMKSSGVKDKDGHKRRIAILEGILELDFRFFALAIDKAEIKKDSALQYKKTFIKFVNGIIYRRLLSTFSNIKIVADEHGGEEFKKSFESYIRKNHKPDLFWKSEIELVSSRDSVLVQLSDFIVGCLSKIYEGKANQSLKEQYYRLLDTKGIDLVEWPTKHQFYFTPDATPAEYDIFIHKHALARAEYFLETYGDLGDEDSQVQVCVLAYLVFKSRFEVDRGYISTKELLSHLKQRGFMKVNEQAIRSSIVAKLRDNDVIIASCNKGYKIPRCYSDLYDFVERVNSQVLPLLERLNRARNSYRIASNEEVDLLKGPNYPELTEFLALLNKKI